MAKKTAEQGCAPGETRATFIVNIDDYEKIKAIAYWERINIKDVVIDAFQDYIYKYEHFNGRLRTKPGFFNDGNKK